MSIKPNFKRDLAIGKTGELAVQKLWPELELLHGKGADAVLPDGTLCEVKTDSYNHDKTLNFFMEIYGDVDSGKLGGPGKALADGCKYFIYYFSSHNIAYVFETLDLMRQLDAYVINHCPQFTEVRNSRYTTVGYRVPRSLLVPSFVLSPSGNVTPPAHGRPK